MSKLLQRLSDASKNGVYRVARADAVIDAVKHTGLHLARVTLRKGDGKAEVLRQLARALTFPSWFGGNWDALEDCLADLSWSTAMGDVLLIEGSAAAIEDDIGVLRDVLASTASYWSERRRPFFAVFTSADPVLPELYRERQ
ncbi:MAG: barstar family protein [Proteobacteria bacterium]|nr:barstar family protein [Pseudomonadota bacterium]